MRMLRRVPAALLALLVMAAFYLFAVMQENEETKRSDAFVVREQEEALTAIAPFTSQDPRALARAFGAAFPLPEGAITGEVSSFRHHGYTARRIVVKGQASQIEGVRPLSAAAAIMPSGLRFSGSDRALFGYSLMSAADEHFRYYALQTDKAAFLLRLPEADSAAPGGGFALQEP